MIVFFLILYKGNLLRVIVVGDNANYRSIYRSMGTVLVAVFMAFYSKKRRLSQALLAGIATKP